MKRKIFNLLILFILLYTFAGCTKLANRMGLNFDSRFADQNRQLYIPPFFEEDLYKYDLDSNIDNANKELSE